MAESDKEVELSEFLEKHQLQPSKWVPLFDKVVNITNPNQIIVIKGSCESYQTLSSNATAKEKHALRKLLDIPEATDNPDVEIESLLEEAGLESKYWLPIFKDELGVTSPQALANLGEESFSTLQPFVRKAWEKKALRKFLGMKEESSFQEQRQNHRKKLKKRQEESQQMLQQLEKLQKEGKDRHDAAVQQIESGIREALQISPDAWIPSDTNLETTIHSLESNIGELDGLLRSREEFSDIQVLQNASGGLALQGILLSRNLDDQMENREKLLKPPDDVQLMGPSLSKFDKIEVFSSQHREGQFRKSMDKLGYSVSASAKGGYGGFSVEVSGGYSEATESEETSEQHQNELFHSALKYSFVPLASCHFSDSQLLLSEEAVRKLKALESFITSKSSDVEVECQRFFDTFGSHAKKGHFHFGGIYWRNSFSEGFEQKSMEAVKRLQQEVVSMNANVSFGSHFGASAEQYHSNIPASFSGRYEEDLVCQTSVEVTATGGPLEVSSLPQWKSGLAASNSTWSVIDCGTTTVPVWEIIQTNHRKDFMNPGKLAQTLHQAWQKRTKLGTESLNTAQPIMEKEEAAEEMEVIRAWCETEEGMANCIQHLSDLLSVKQSLVRKSMNLQAWPDHYLSKPPVQRYLRLVMEAKKDASGADTEYIKLLMRQLIKPSDARLVKDLIDVSDWLYHSDNETIVALECTDIATLITIIENHVKEMDLAKARSNSLYEELHEQQDVKIRATTIVAKAVNYLRTCFSETGQKYEELFLVTLLLPCQYDVRDRIFRQLLSAIDLEYLKKELKEQSKEFGDESPMKLQAYLFHLTVTMHSREDVDVSKTQVIHHLEYLQNELKGDIDPNVSHVLSQFLSNKCGWKVAQFHLASLEKGIQLEKIQEGNELSDILSQTETTQPSENSKGTQIPKPVAKVPSGKVQELFNKLDLLRHYPQKLTLQDAMLIRQETLGNEQCTKLEMLPYFIMQKLMMHDYQCRGVLFRDRTTPSTVTLAKSSQKHDDFDDTPSSVSSSSEATLSTVHPVDGLLALLHSSDNFLRQELTARLSTCQLAIPFLLPDPITRTLSLSLWAMHTIAKEWKFTDPNTGEIKSDGSPIVNYPTPIISFCRLTSNRSELSKSRILNDVISDYPHNYFFHFHCDGGSTKSLLMDGLVELCWYLPAGKSNDPFTQVITFTNLRGNALSHPKQTKFLSQVSFMNFVLLTEDNLDEEGIEILQGLAKGPGGVVLMFLDKTFTQRERMTRLMKTIPKSQCFRMKLSGKSAADIKASIREQIKDKLACSQQKFRTIEECAEVARGNGIKIDKDDPDCVQGRALANEVQRALNKLQTSDKDEVLPLQSRKLWHEWARHDKEKHQHMNRGAKGIEQYNEQMEEEKQTIRTQQLSIAEHPSPVMKTFLSNLLKHKGIVRHYFLQWLKFALDDHSRKTLLKLFSQYKEVRKRLLKLQREHKTGKEEAKGPLKVKLEKLNEQLVHASFGLEHLLREIGQIYEATVEQEAASPKLRKLVNCLPQVAAELLASGYPLELMDGDASHVPLCWVMAVLGELRKLLQNPRLFVLSVLGIQSTGKSTLLNTMFGLRFAVSAGRCTRGAFIQLLPLNESLKEEMKCDYLLIVDTEGLRAPELSSHETQKHDNELATFVIGLANVTLINIFGETPGNIDDILQRAVHAFIRMEKVGLKPSCQFVHQNVGAVSGASRGMMGRVNFQEKLNAMTRAAAKEENLEGHYTMFGHVIDFNEEKDVWYFPGLWKGDPPMAPVNPGYSDGAQLLKSGLIERTTVHLDAHSVCLLSAFQTRIEDLWEAILHENFIFSFKNTLEITAYNHLDAKYGKWSWEFQRRMLEWLKTAENRIRSTEIDKLSDLKRSLTSELSEEGGRIHADLQSEVKTFFEENEQRETLAQWQRRTELRLVWVRKEQKADAQHQCSVLISSRQALAKADSLKKFHLDELQCLVKRLASNLEKGMLNDMELEKLYEDKWIEWLTDLKANQQIDQSKPDIVGSLEKSLRDLLAAHYQLLNPKLSEKPLRNRTNRDLTVIPCTHITANQIIAFKRIVKEKSSFSVVQPAHKEIANRETQKILSKARQYLEDKIKTKGNFNPTFCHQLLRNLLEDISDAQKQYPEFNFTPEYKVDMALTVSGHALRVFEKMAEGFKLMNDPVEYLQREMKTPFLRLFKSQYYQTAQEKVAAYNLCDCLVKPMEDALKSSLAQSIAVEVKVNFPTKRALKFKILSDLADRQSFSDYALYLKDLKRSVQKWVIYYVNQYCEQREGETKRLTKLAETELEHLVVLIGKAANKITSSFPSADIQTWLGKFHCELMMDLPLDLKEMQEVVGNVKDLENFTEELCKSLADLNIKMEQFKSATDVYQWDKKPHEFILKSLTGCREQCPFCKEECELTNPDHDKHSVSLHRSQCLGGWRWSNSKVMVLDTCNAIVAGNGEFSHLDEDGNQKYHPDKKFQEVYPSWQISPDSSIKVASYWKWVLCRYTREIAELYKMEPAEIPEAWSSLTREDVKEELKQLYLL